MPLFRSDYCSNVRSAAIPQYAGQLAGHRGAYTVPTSQADGDQVELVILPPRCTPIDIWCDRDTLDSGAELDVDCGIFSGEVGDTVAVRTVGNEVFDGETANFQGATPVVIRPTLKTAYRIAPTGVSRSIGFLINTNAATAVAGVLALTLIYAQLNQ